MLDRDTVRIYRFVDLTKRLRHIQDEPFVCQAMSTKVKLVYLVLETIKLDIKHQQSSIAHSPDDGADG
jgi:hypothetical protein